MYCTLSGGQDRPKLLLRRGADPTVVTAGGESALTLCVPSYGAQFAEYVRAWLAKLTLGKNKRKDDDIVVEEVGMDVPICKCLFLLNFVNEKTIPDRGGLRKPHLLY